MFSEVRLTCWNGDDIALKSVHIDGRVDGLLSTTTVTQRYRNDGGRAMEVVYAFSLARGAELLGMDVILKNRRLRAVIVDGDEARARYEEATDAQDGAILVVRDYFDLYTINIGYLEGGGEVAVEFRCAQLLRHSGRTTHLRIPCVIAPRHGSPREGGGLAAHESAKPDILAEYPLSARIVLRGRNAQAEVTYTSHECGVNMVEDGKEIVLRSGAMLDRDFSISFTGLSEKAIALSAPDGREHIMLATFRPELQTKKNPLRLKILLDCSGSMAGVGIETAKKALWSLIGSLDRGDSVSFCCFGNSVRHDIEELQAWSLKTQIKLFESINDARADMGGIKIVQALVSIFNGFEKSAAFHKIDTPPKSEGDVPPSCVLLVTNAATWNMERIIDAGASSGHRIFTLGVGSAPAESLLGELADKTGGACEIVPFSEDGSSEIANLVNKMRTSHATSMRIDWGDKPLWQSTLPLSLYDGDTVHAFASFATAPTRPPVLCWTVDGREERLALDGIERIGGDVLPRLGGARRIDNAESCDDAYDLALKYQLLREDTAMIFIHVREEEKDMEPPLVHIVPQMMAAGHGGFGVLYQCLEERKRFEKSVPMPRTLLHAFDKHASTGIDGMQAVRQTMLLVEHSELGAVLKSLAQNYELPVEQVMVVLLHWLEEVLRWSNFSLSTHSQHLLREEITSISSDPRIMTINRLEEVYPEVGLEKWGRYFGADDR